MNNESPVTNGDVAGSQGSRLVAVAAVARITGSVIVRPSLWRPAFRAVVAFAPRRWWRHRPFLPLPSRNYMAFRMQTQYGGSGSHPFEPSDVLEYLRWLQRWT